MPNKKLYIHIGNHKTGTTSLQHALLCNAPALAGHGLKLFHENHHTGLLQQPHVHSWLGFINSEFLVPYGMRVTAPELLAEKLDQMESDVIISSENFSFFFEQSAIDELRDHLEKFFSEIHIVCYLRRQDRHIISHHQEGSKLYRRAENNLFGHSTRAIPDESPFHSLYLDYNRRLGLWAKAFGQDRLTLRIYDRKQLHNNDVVSDFFSLLGIDSFQATDEKNVSLGFNDVKLGHIINSSSDLQHKSSLINILQSGPDDRYRLLPSRSEARRYYSRYRECNAALNSRFRISENPDLFDDDFSDYPEVAQDYWTEESATAAITGMLHRIDNNYADLDADELRDTAVAMSKSNPEIAVKLLRIAHVLRPEGQWIKHLLDEYNNAGANS